MMNPMHRPNRLLVLLVAATMSAAPVLAAPPPWAGGGKHTVDDHAEHAPRKAKKEGVARKPVQPGAYFDDRNRDAVQKYYASRSGKACPPGLAKKNNGCLPPGQAKKWQVGQALPAGVVLAPVPQPILVTLPPVPAGHRYVQVAGDILLIAIGTKMVVDGINGLTSR